MRRNFVLISLAAVLAVVEPSSAKARVDAVNQDENKIAMHGYDPVAYFTDGRPVKGSTQFAVDWMEAKWMFASADHRDLFQKDPGKYAPQYGAYCAWAVSKGSTANGDPHAWRIVNGKLYLNYSKPVQAKWEKDPAARIQEGDRNWPGLHK